MIRALIQVLRGTVAAIAVLLMAAAGALAQTSPAPQPNAAAGTASAANTVEQRITALHDQLRVTDAQAPLWTSFAQAMRENATATDAMFRQRASVAASMTALDNMKSYAQVARAYADNTEKLAAAFEPLYAALSDQQRQAMDTLFRQQVAQGTPTQPVRR